MKNSGEKSGGRFGVVGVIILIALAGFVSAKDAWARSPKVKDEPILKVGVYNYAHIGALELREAEDQAGRLFARAGVRIVWVDCALKESEVSSHPDCSSRDVVLRLLPVSMSDAFNSHAEALGAAISTTEPEGAWVASVFYGRVESLTSAWTLDLGLLLGEAAVHELGHLMLGPSHARDGIMQANWSQQDLQRASRGELKFTAGETASLKDALATLRSNAAPLLASRNK